MVQSLSLDKVSTVCSAVGRFVAISGLRFHVRPVLVMEFADLNEFAWVRGELSQEVLARLPNIQPDTVRVLADGSVEIDIYNLTFRLQYRKSDLPKRRL